MGQYRPEGDTCVDSLRVGLQQVDGPCNISINY